MGGAEDGGVFEFGFEGLFVKGEEFVEVDFGKMGVEGGFVGCLCVLVPGAGVLAGVAAKQSISQFFGEVLWDWAAVLDSEVGDASAGVHNTGLGECAGGACVEAAGA